MSNYVFAINKKYQVVFEGGLYVNIDTSGLSETIPPRPNEVNKLFGEEYYDATEYLTTRGIQTAAMNIAYVRDITSDPTMKPNAIAMVTTALPYYIEFSALGQYQVTTDVDGLQYVPFPGAITGAFLTRAIAGTSSDSIVDVHKNGTTLWTTQANRPKIAWNDGDKKVIATLPDVTSLAEGDLLSFDVDQIEAGGAADLRLKLRVVPTI